jgi:hypothetical protein
LEVSIFGPGFGECVVLHLGGGHWGVVDSCLDPGSKRPAALHYFQSIGINAEASVRFVVATHWHDDHIQGISSLFQEAKTAVFACTEAVGKPEFSEVLAAWTGTRYLAGGSGVDELRAVLTELKKRQPATRYPTPKLASANKVLWELAGNLSATVKALSPLDAAVMATMAQLRKAMPKFSRARRRLPNLTQNDASVVLSVRVADHLTLLGADLEVRNDRGLGWMAIVDGIGSGAAVHQGFKVAHHGSPNADHDEIWNRLLMPQPWAATTPFVSGSVRLPSVTDCRRIFNRARASYLTAPPHPTKFRDPDRTVERTVREATISAHFVPGKYGHVRLRKRVDEPVDGAWRVEMFGHALKLEDYLASAQ